MGELSGTSKTELLWSNIRRFDHYIATTNAKSAAILAFDGLIIGSVLVKFNAVTNLFAISRPALILSNLLLCGLGVVSGVSMIYAFRVINPFLESGNVAGEYHSILFFGSVVGLSRETYGKKVDGIDQEKLLSDLKSQSYTLAEGLAQKMRDLRWSISFIFMAIVLVIGLFLLKGAAAIGLI